MTSTITQALGLLVFEALTMPLLIAEAAQNSERAWLGWRINRHLNPDTLYQSPLIRYHQRIALAFIATALSGAAEILPIPSWIQGAVGDWAAVTTLVVLFLCMRDLQWYFHRAEEARRDAIIAREAEHQKKILARENERTVEFSRE